MPTITLQVGQCGNQLGQALWECLQAQSAAAADPLADVEHFKCTAQGARRARCLLVDTEPKVVNAVLAQDRAGIFSRSRCFLGQSGRGNNWAFGYRQLAPVGGGTRQPASAASGGARWNSSTAAEDPNQQEFHILEQVLDGIRREAEECDGAPSFLLLHSLGGGSGSGTGSRVLEHLREEYPLSYIAAASIAPRETGDTPMQSLNAVLALSFLQAYADVVLLFSNRELLDVAARREQLLGAGGSGGGPGGGSTDLADLNRVIARRLAGCLWPLDAADALGGRGRIRDLATTVASDPCTKLLETWTVHAHANTPTHSLWQDSVRAIHAAVPKHDQQQRPITTAGALLLARGYPAAAVAQQQQPAATALAAYTKALGGTHGAPLAAVPGANLHLRCGVTPLAKDLGAASPARPVADKPPPAGGSGSLRAPPSLTAVCNRSSTIGLLEGTAQRALAVCQAGAYLHWYAKHGCPKEAIEEAAFRMSDVASCYRQLHLQGAAER